MNKKQEITQERKSIQDIIGKGYAEFWKSREDEIILMGGKGSKKSYTTAIKFMYLLAKYPKACLLCIRKNGNTLRDSCWAMLKKASEMLGMQKDWKFTTTPLGAKNIKTGQQIFFRGCQHEEDWQKIASITPEKHGNVLCFCWVEEAYEIDSEESFKNISLSIRGKLPNGYFKQFVYTLNPWSEDNFIVKELTKSLTPDEGVLAARYKQVANTSYEVEIEVEGKNGKKVKEKETRTRLLLITNYKLNEFLDSKNIAEFEEMKEKNPVKYRTAGLGMPGVEPGNIFKAEWFTNLYDDLPLTTYKVLSVDATFKKESKTKGKETDYVALQVWGIGENGYYLINRVKKHLSFTETLQEITRLVSYHPDLSAILIEDKANGSAIIDVLRNKYPFVIGVEPLGGKLSRASAVAPMFEAGAVWLPNKMWLKEYIAEFIAFPNAVHDDEVDCTSQALSRIRNVYVTTLSEKEKDHINQDEKEYKEILETMGIGLSIDDIVSTYADWESF